MAILTAQNISKSFAADEIFSDISVQVPHGAKIALVGPNGAGKTTLIKILIGQDKPTDGDIHTKKGLTIGFLPQRPDFDSNRTIREEMMTAFQHLIQLQDRLTELEHAMADPAREAEHDELLEQYGSLQHSFEDQGGYTYEYDMKRVLQGLGFSEEAFDEQLGILSGGQKTRALLARLLLQKPDLLVLDEPTNHLDIGAVEWLEGYLKSLDGALLMVSHDRYFMDRVVDTVWELDFGGIEVYNGNYSHYVRQREERHERLMQEFEAQQAFIEKEQEYIRRHMGSQNTAQARGRLRRLERMMSSTDRRGREGSAWLIQRPRTRSKMHLRLDSAGRTGNEVLRVNNLHIGYPDAPLFDVDEILLLRKEVAALIGSNGAGKSTFLKTILGKLDPLQGRYRWGTNVKVGYFAQAHETLNENNTIIEELFTVRHMPTSEARNYLAQFLFSGDDVFRKIETLSGGERGRLALAKLSLSGTNVLLLDEPTNHLDIAAQEILQNVLADYDGTILLVSHDRYIIDALATQIWRIEDDTLAVFNGTYTEFMVEHSKVDTAIEEPSATANSNQQHSAPARNDVDQNKKANGLNPYQRKKRLSELESEIQALEAEIEELTAEIESASASGDIAKVTELGNRYSTAEATLDVRMDEWMNLA